jgi:hypothetical protein
MSKTSDLMSTITQQLRQEYDTNVASLAKPVREQTKKLQNYALVASSLSILSSWQFLTIGDLSIFGWSIAGTEFRH